MRTLTAPELTQIVDDLYSEADDDVVGLWEVVKLVGDQVGEGDAVQEACLSIVQALMNRGLLAGDPPFHGGEWEPWPNQDTPYVSDRIRREWERLGHTPSIPDIVWFGRPSLGASTSQ